MRIVGFAAQNVSDFDERKHRALIADNHASTLNIAKIADGVDAVVAHLDSQAADDSWVEMVKTSPYFISVR